MNIENIINSIISGLISGAITIVGVLITIRNDNKWKRKEERKNIFKEKPKFSVQKAEDEAKADIQVLVASFECIKDDENGIQFVYDKKLKKDKEIVSKDYIFENTGKSAAKYFSVIMNEKKHFSIFEYSRRKSWLESRFINYYVLYDKKEIEPGQTIRLRLYRHKDENFSSYAYAGLSIYFTDEYGNYWEQPFFNGDAKLYGPYQKTHKDYIDDISTDTALECFENPMLW